MRFVLEPDGNELGILNRDTDIFAAYVRPLKLDSRSPRFSVKTPRGHEIAVVKSVDEAIPAVVAYYKSLGIY